MTGDTATEAGVDKEEGPKARALTSDTQSIASTSSWLLWEPQPALSPVNLHSGGRREVGQPHSISHALIHSDTQHNSLRAWHVQGEAVQLDHLLTRTQPTSSCATLAWQHSLQRNQGKSAPLIESFIQ